MKYRNVVVPVTNYATSALQKTLTQWGELGYKFVNAIMVDNQYDCKTMYLFFVKGCEQE